MAAAAAAATTTLNALFMSPPYTHTKQVKETKALASNLSRHLYTPGRVSGTGSNIGIKIHGDYIPKLEQLIAMSPSGFQERIIPEDMYTISYNGAVLSSPAPMGYPHKAPKPNDCAPIFMKADYLFDAVIKLHQFGVSWSTPSHGPMQNVKHSWCNDRTIYNRFVPLAMPNGNDALELSRRCILLDIEGTTTPISFVTDVLFPYARDNVRKHLAATYDSEETKDDIKLLRAQVEDDLEQGLVGVQPIPPDDAGKEEVITSLVANVEAMIRADRKIISLKQLQGHIWRTGFQSDELKGAVFEDVPEALKKWNDSGIKVYIYSSGSRESQRLIFGKSNYGDLRKYLCGFFDTTIGNKRETRSYFEISQSVGVDSPSEILFLTDVYQEAVAAKAAGLEVIISIRPGNGPLPENHGFNTIESFSEV